MVNHTRTVRYVEPAHVGRETVAPQVTHHATAAGHPPLAAAFIERLPPAAPRRLDVDHGCLARSGQECSGRLLVGCSPQPADVGKGLASCQGADRFVARVQPVRMARISDAPPTVRSRPHHAERLGKGRPRHVDLEVVVGDDLPQNGENCRFLRRVSGTLAVNDTLQVSNGSRHLVRVPHDRLV